MISEASGKRLCNLIKKYKASSNVASFRDEYRDVVFAARSENKIKQADVDLLMQARDWLEGWAGPTPPTLAIAFEQWQKLYEAGKKAVPVSLLECFLRRLPQPNNAVVDCESFILSCSDAQLIDVLLERRLVQEQYLNCLAETKTHEFYHSAALDVMVERAALRNPRPLWDQCIQGRARPHGLMTREEILINCYAISPGDSENEQMLSFLLATPENREKVLRKLLTMRVNAVRLCCYLTFGDPKVAMLDRDRVLTGVQDILIDWIRNCQTELEKGDASTAETAALILAITRLSALTKNVDTKVGKPNQPNQLYEEATRVGQKAVLMNALQKLERGRSSVAAETVWILLGKELFQVIQDYLRQLHVGTNTGQESPERALRLERYLGSKQVIEQVLSAVEETSDDTRLRDSLEVALFNCGVRPLGEVGQEVPFDVRAHETEVPDVLPDDLVVITNPGRRLGDQEEARVLVRAKVRPAAHADSLASPGEST